MTEDFRPELLPDDALESPGPIRPRRIAPRTSGAGFVGNLKALFSASSPTDYVTIRARYYNAGESEYVPLPGANVKIETCERPIWKSICDPEDFTETTYSSTNPSGYVYVSSGDWDGYQVTVAAKSAKIGTVPSASTAVYGDDDDCGGATQQATTSSAGSHVFVNLGKSWEGSSSLFSRSRSFIYAYVDDWANSSYDDSNDSIKIKDDANPSHIWGEWGAFIEAHEYGHAFFYDELGVTTSANCPNPHFLSGAHNLTCAWVEGLADFHGAATRPDLEPWTYHTRMESDYWYPADTGSGDRDDGAIIEGAVGAFLFDITDGVGGTGETHDSVECSGSYLASAIETCEVKENGNWKDAEGIDHLIWCLENDVDTLVTGGSDYFQTRSNDPTDERETASEPGSWSQRLIRKLWLSNLYGGTP